jgi:hypothetical protein
MTRPLSSILYPPSSILKFALAAVWFLVVFFLTRWAATSIPLSGDLAVLGTTVLLLIATAPLEYIAGKLDFRSLIGWVGLAIVGGVGLVANLLFTRAQLPGPASLGLLLFAVAAGVLLGRFALLDRDLLLLVVVLYILVDVYSVFFGPTQVIIEQGGPLLSVLTMRFPILGTARVASLVGATDFLVWAACLQAAFRFGFPYRASFAALGLGLFASGVVSLTLDRAVPALPLMMLFFLGVNYRRFNWRNRQLWGMAAGLLVVVIGIGAAATWWLRR